MKTPLRSQEILLKEGLASYKKPGETVGGKLYLTNRRLIFEAHAFNIQGGVTSYELAAVKSAEPCWTRLAGIPLVPNGLLVKTTDVKTHRFVVFGRHDWAARIEMERSS